MRLFVALNFSDSQRADVHAAAARLHDERLPVRWVPPENLHVTLKFLGEVRKEAVPEVEAALDRVARGNGPFTVRLSGFGAFPTIRRPRVIWLGVDPAPPVRCLKQDLEWALAEGGFERDPRAFHPHVTLGRVDRDAAAGAFRGLDDVVADMGWTAEYPVTAVDLMRSRLDRSGPRYSIVSSSNLAGAD